MGGLGKLVGGSLGGIVDSITGEVSKDVVDTRSTSSSSIQGKTDAEIQRQKVIDDLFNQAVGSAGSDDPVLQQQVINSLFKDLLTSFITSDFGANPTPEDIAAATQFVDATYTQPAQAQFQQFAQDFQGAQQSNAAARGRQPEDIGFQAELFKTLATEQGNIANTRGSLIQQQALGQRQQGIQNQTAQLGAVQSGAGFFNNAANQLMQNRLGLLNAGTIQQQQGLDERSRNVKTIGSGNQSAFTTGTAGTRVAGGVGGAVNLGSLAFGGG